MKKVHEQETSLQETLIQETSDDEVPSKPKECQNNPNHLVSGSRKSKKGQPDKQSPKAKDGNEASKVSGVVSETTDKQSSKDISSDHIPPPAAALTNGELPKGLRRVKGITLNGDLAWQMRCFSNALKINSVDFVEFTHQEKVGVLTYFLEQLGVKVRKKDGSYSFGIASKAWKSAKTKQIIDGLHALKKKYDAGELTNPTGYWNAIIKGE